MSFKATESYPVSGKNTQSMEIEAPDQHFKDKSLSQKILPENPINSTDEEIKEEEKKEGENLKHSCSDDHNESEIKDERHPF